MSRPLRVLLVTKGLDLGGIERVVVDLAVGLSESGVDVEVALVNSDRDRLAPALDDAGIRLHRLDGSDLVGFTAARRLATLLATSETDRFDVVHVHGPLPSAIVRVLCRRRSGRPRVVTTSHTPWSSLRLPTRLAWQATAGLDAATIAVSAAVAASLPARAHARAIVVPHGIDPQRISKALAAGRRAPGTPSTSDGLVTVMTVASHRDAKNYPNLLRAVRAAIDLGAPIRLVSVGEGPSLADHVALAAELGLADVVTFIPATDDVLSLIAGADILAVASDYEGQPIVVAEALALGLPVVATAVGRVPEMVNTTVGRVVPPRDPAALGVGPPRAGHLACIAG